MNKIIKGVIILSVLSILLSSCNIFKDINFGEVKIGENFMSSRDGYYKKLPYNYCLNVNLRSKAQLFKVDDKYIDTTWDFSLFYDCIILEGHFIKGFYDSKYLVLCEEKDDDTILYVSFNFLTGVVQNHTNIGEVYNLFENPPKQWFVLCNTNKEIQYIT